jgi:hypothetical protein
MGTPIDKPYSGSFCSICWGVGKTFGDVPTPSTVFVTFSGIQLIDGSWPFDEAFVNRRFALGQVVGTPCRWLWVWDDLFIQLLYGSDRTDLLFGYTDESLNVFSAAGDVCDLFITSYGSPDPPNPGYGGDATIDFGDF